ncbi:MAG: hypothetical protein HY043_02750 [Verrucomicrobia bacterium]|nr:hypothetical protein [Verrucomicrobiota bacterium]
MRTPEEDAPLTPPEREIAALAKLYDRFAHSLDPFSAGRDEAEATFMQSIADWYDSLDPPKPTLHEFRKGVIVRCKKHLSASDKPSAIPPG